MTATALTPVDAAATAASLDSPATWPLVRLMQHIEAHQAVLGADGVVALYELWLAHHRGPDAVGAHFNLGAVLQSLGRLGDAERHYREVLRTLDLPEARQNLALVLERCGRSDEAAAQWRRLVASAAPRPARLAAAAGLVRVARQQGRRDELRRALAQSLELDAGQPALRDELDALDLAAAAVSKAAMATWPQPAAAGDPVIYVVAVCFNEAPILPFFLDHYIHYLGARKVFLHDGGSTDGSAEIAARYPEVEFSVAPSEKLDDRDLMRTRNEEWKKYREQCDWMVVCDVDEFLYHPDIRQALKDLKREGVTLPLVEGYNMISKSHPVHRPGRYLWQERQAGWADPRYLNKNLIFDPSIDINYTLGCHGCLPTGPVVRSAGAVFKNLHMCMPSYRHVIEKSRRSAARLSDWNKQTNAGFHYRINAELTQAQYNAKFLAAANVVEPRLRPTTRREGHEALLRWLTLRDDDARVLEFGSAGDSGSTAFFAWYVHNNGGRLLSVDADARRGRHARFELARAGLLSERVGFVQPEALRSGEGADERYDLVHFNAAEHYGDGPDRAAGQRQVLLQFLDIEALLAPGALVVLDEPAGVEREDGRFALLAALLAGRGWSPERHTDTLLFSRAA
ncbi:MAG: glycosyltransferase family 2 protein [Rubrivivax sp.]|nr:glycosyltransferase family 2 protein [Rubrivivax sp.]